jgi:5-(aminomethyl)-3-furanmethanol phosphate kinase
LGLTVAKVGGSLYGLPGLRERLRTWIAGVGKPVLLVPGGGAVADVVRHLDRVHGLGEETAHWLALRALTVNAHFLAQLLEVQVVHLAGEERLAVLDAHAFCLADEGRPGSLPHAWAATSDAVAARVTEVAGADLVLLKSADLAAGMSWSEAAAAGLVDETFDTIVRRAGLRATWVNLRSLDSPRR